MDTLREIGCELAARHEFADHQPYNVRDIEPIIKRALSCGTLVVTTEKDFGGECLNLLRSHIPPLRVEIEWDDANQIDVLLETVI